jgi:hypothetical protein
LGRPLWAQSDGKDTIIILISHKKCHFFVFHLHFSFICLSVLRQNEAVFCRKSPVCFAAKHHAFCRKIQRVLLQSAVRFAAKQTGMRVKMPFRADLALF